MEKSNKLLAALSIALVASIVAIWFFAFREDRQEVNQDVFKVPNLEKVNRVEFKSARGQVTLKFNGNKWQVNDQYNADRQMISYLFATVESMRPRRPVSEKIRKEVDSQLTTAGTMVEFFVDDQPVSSFIAGGNQSKTESWFRTKDGDTYVVHIPGYRAFAAGIFEQGLGDWRDKRVFDFNWRNFKSLTTSFPKSPSEAFTIAMRDNIFAVEGIEEVDTAKVNTYLDDVSLLAADRFYLPGGNVRTDSLLSGPISFEVKVFDVGNSEYVMEVFPPLRTESNVFARYKGEIMVFKKAEIARIAKKRTWFKAPPAQP